jgi:hypothetical protein
MRSRNLTIFVFILAYTNVHGSVIFDSFTEPNIGGVTSEDIGAATQISVSVETTITNISVLNNMPYTGQLKFVIFSHPTHEALFVSLPQLFGPDADKNPTWKTSSDFSLTLLAGNEYDIGSISDVVRYDVVDKVSESQNGIIPIVGS